MANKIPCFRCVLVAVMALISAIFPVQSLAGEPLVTIRFNQPRVYFDQQLYSAVSKAFSVKPEVEFDVVSYAPSTSNTQLDADWQKLAGRNTRSVIAVMMQMGVPMERIHVTGKAQTGLRYDETLVFVR